MSQTSIGLKVYADKLEPFIHWDVDYFEIYIRHIDHLGKPTTLEAQLELLAPIADKVFGIHGGILHQGVNFFDVSAKLDNQKAIDIVNMALPTFPNCKYVVFHPGCFVNHQTCSFETLYSWIDTLKDDRFMIENEAFLCYKERFVFPIWRPEDFLAFKKKTNKEILVDTGHALILARIMKLDPVAYISELIDVLNPSVIHLATNDTRGDGYEDSHLPLAQGTLNFKALAPKLKDRLLTIEVGDLSLSDLDLVKSIV